MMPLSVERSDLDLMRTACLEKAATVFCEPKGCLAHPYVHPGGPYGDNLWDWDAYWALKAVSIMSKVEAVGQGDTWRHLLIRHGSGSLNNFFDHQGEDGSLPILLTPEDPDCFDSTCAVTNNMAKPALGLIALLLADHDVAKEDLRRWCGHLAAYYACYESRYLHSCGLYVWANDIAIGGDDDPTAWGRPPFSSGNMFLNSFLYADLMAAQKVASRMGEQVLARRWGEQASALASAMQSYCWDPKDGFFYSADVACTQQTSPSRLFGVLNENLEPFWKCLPLKVLYWAGFLPMWNGLAKPEQADRLVREHLMNEKEFWSPHGVRTLSADERMYDPSTARGNPSNWLGPVWGISNYLVWEGLKAYGYDKEAQQVAHRTIALFARDLKASGGWHENYHPDTGDALAAPDFISWNLLVYPMILETIDQTN